MTKIPKGKKIAMKMTYKLNAPCPGTKDGKHCWGQGVDWDGPPKDRTCNHCKRKQTLEWVDKI